MTNWTGPAIQAMAPIQFRDCRTHFLPLAKTAYTAHQADGQ